MVKDFFTIIKIYGAYYEIYSPETGIKLAVLRGKLRTKKQVERHPFVVGDYVTAIQNSSSSKNEEDQDEYTIDETLERRKNFLIRQSSAGDKHVLCANVHQVAILASLKNPEFKYSFIDRCLAAVSVADIIPIIIFTKKDLVSEEEVYEKTKLYSELGYQVQVTSLNDQDSLEKIKILFKDKVTYLVGNSGVGKSSLLNYITGQNIQSIQEVSESSLKGKHTTTNTNAILIDKNSILIDSPGIKEWGVLHLDKEDLIQSFPELKKAREKCEYKYCCDFGKNCNITTLLASDSMNPNRKKSYLMMLESLERPTKFTRKDWIKKSLPNSENSFSD